MMQRPSKSSYVGANPTSGTNEIKEVVEMTYIDIKTNKIVEIIKEINSTTVRVKRLKDNVTYIVPREELKEAN